MKTEPLASNDYEGAEVRLCEDGKYRWKYELNMITNPIIFITVFKIFFYIILVGFVFFGTILYAIHGDWAGLLGMGKVMLLVLGGFAVLTFLGILLISPLYGGKYVVQFEMDEKELAHIQLPVQADRARKFGFLAFLIGIAAKRPTTAGAGLLSTAKNSSTSELARVKRIKCRRRLHTIKLNETLEHNQVYVPDEDYEFVYEFLKSHCPNANY